MPDNSRKRNILVAERSYFYYFIKQFEVFAFIVASVTLCFPWV